LLNQLRKLLRNVLHLDGLEAIWLSAIEELVRKGYVQDVSGKKELYRGTRNGYEYNDKSDISMPLSKLWQHSRQAGRWRSVCTACKSPDCGGIETEVVRGFDNEK
jgi:hypothetical protein